MKAFFRLFVNPPSPLFFKWYAQLIGFTQGFRGKIILFEKLDTHFSSLLLHFHWLKFALLALYDKRDRRLIKKTQRKCWDNVILMLSESRVMSVGSYVVPSMDTVYDTRPSMIYLLLVYDRYQTIFNRLSSNSIWVFLSLYLSFNILSY